MGVDGPAAGSADGILAGRWGAPGAESRDRPWPAQERGIRPWEELALVLQEWGLRRQALRQKGASRSVFGTKQGPGAIQASGAGAGRVGWAGGCMVRRFGKRGVKLPWVLRINAPMFLEWGARSTSTGCLGRVVETLITGLITNYTPLKGIYSGGNSQLYTRAGSRELWSSSCFSQSHPHINQLLTPMPTHMRTRAHTHAHTRAHTSFPEQKAGPFMTGDSQSHRSIGLVFVVSVLLTMVSNNGRTEDTARLSGAWRLGVMLTLCASGQKLPDVPRRQHEVVLPQTELHPRRLPAAHPRCVAAVPPPGVPSNVWVRTRRKRVKCKRREPRRWERGKRMR